MVLLDRNLLSALLHISRDGHLKSEKETRIIALLMTWILLNDFPASAGLAIKEQATKIDDPIIPRLELREFNNIFDYYPSMLWLRLFEGLIDEIPKCTMQVQPFITNIDYNEEDDHLLMHIAEMLHVVYLYRQKGLSPADKMIQFLKWYYDNLLICESTLAYVAMLFTNQQGIKPPRSAGQNNLSRILDGCRNQAWDLNYLSNWSCFYYDEDKMDDIFLFATNDVQLKMIFINTYYDTGINGLLHAVFSCSDYKRILDIIEIHSGGQRIKPNFGNNPPEYLRQLIVQETQLVERRIFQGT
jgi:hypothetical protein